VLVLVVVLTSLRDFVLVLVIANIKFEMHIQHHLYFILHQSLNKITDPIASRKKKGNSF